MPEADTSPRLPFRIGRTAAVSPPACRGNSDKTLATVSYRQFNIIYTVINNIKHIRNYVNKAGGLDACSTAQPSSLGCLGLTRRRCGGLLRRPIMIWGPHPSWL